MEKSNEIGKLALALSKAQGEMKNATKDAENPFFKSKYADLATVIDTARKALKDNELAIVQLAEESDDHAIVSTVLMHSSGEWISSRLKLRPVKNDPQGIGSAMTYARRYAYAAIIGMASEEDDDGNAATHESASKEKPVKIAAEYRGRAVAAIEKADANALDAIGKQIDADCANRKISEEDKTFLAKKINERREATEK